MNLLIVSVVLFGAGVSLANRGFGPGEQKWGFVEVRQGAHMFYWLYMTTANVYRYTDRPLIIWLQGGPGSSSTGFGNFKEIGPLDENLKPRNTTWVKDANVLFIDNPVGAGFSYFDDSEYNFATNNTQIAYDLVEFMRGFYKRFSEFQDSPLYILSESYGGKMAIEFAYHLNVAAKRGHIRANLRGVGLGDSWISPVDSVLTWAPYLLNLGVIDKAGYKIVDDRAKLFKVAVDRGEYHQAQQLTKETQSLMSLVSDNVDFYNVLKRIGLHTRLRGSPYNTASLDPLMNEHVKKQLHLNVTWRLFAQEVWNNLEDDMMKSVTDIVTRVLDTTDIKVFVYNGQLDLIVDTPGTLNWVDNLRSWSQIMEWGRAERFPVVVNDVVEGYVKSTGNLYFYWVNRAGHMVPADNPAAMDVILRNMTNNYSGL